MGQLMRKTAWQLLDELNIEIPYDPAIARLGPYPKVLNAGSLRDLHTHVYSSIIHNSQKVEETPGSTDG